ncbi:16S rRNA (uracil(1498)-N(3))-methyltransferase [Mangrovimicrobium sediminis]|uniref:16S rRNA (uracil(1498)-N(3))-methyltransferase n=1 Tax=Mangrovimicrobium sediminis TaxID=2562682 RepID=UPI001F0D8494|nr:16S rRNA (uracil(1498)-N(3))-methyltransferase [Haliea sp. SAOS-164]
MNLLLFGPEARDADGRVRVSGQQLRHLRQVLGKGVGDTVRAGEIGGLMGCAGIVAIDKHSALLEPQLDTPPPPKLPLVLVLALPRPKMLRRTLRALAEFGVGEVHLVNSWKVEKSYWQTPVLAPATLREYCLQGLEQACDTVLPAIHLCPRFKPFAEDTLPGLLAGRRGLVAHPGDYPPCPRAPGGELLLAVGPEGGFTPYEVDMLSAPGCEAVSLGPRILRVENAVSALLARLF